MHFLVIFMTHKVSSWGEFLGVQKRGLRSWICIAKTESQVVQVFAIFHVFLAAKVTTFSRKTEFFGPFKSIKMYVSSDVNLEISGAKRKIMYFVKTS